MFELSGEVYSAKYVNNVVTRGSLLCGKKGEGNKGNNPAGCAYLLDLYEVVEEFENYYGGSVSCYNSDYKYVADFNIYHTSTYSDQEGSDSITALYGVQVSGPTDDNKLDTISYCKITGFRKDLSMFAFFNFDTKDDFETGVNIEGDLVDIITGLYNFPNTGASSSININMTCLNPTENENKDRDKTISRIYPVKVEKGKGYESTTITIKSLDKDDPSHVPIGKCSFLYSKQFGPIPLMSSDISAIIGQDGVAGRIETGIVLWGGQTSETPTESSTQPRRRRRRLDSESNTPNDEGDGFTDEEGTGTEVEDNEEEEDKREDNVKPGETEIVENYVPPALKIFQKLDPDAKIITPSRQEVQQAVVKGATVDVMQFSECSNSLQSDGVRVKTCGGPMLKATATITTIDEESNSFKYTPELLFTQKENTEERLRSLQTSGTTSTPAKTNDKDFAFLVNTAGAHPQVECSGRGACDRNTGVCKCDEGYQGSACQRRTCPNNCSGKGKCLPLSDVTNPQNKDVYGQDIIYACKCDGGYRGNDCSLIECPSKKDPYEATNTDANSEFRDCSGRGKCDYTTGVCTCFGGYSGSACEIVQSTF